ncbi:MAG: type III-B CRISPR module-associated protein Cmr5 [Acidithiobacillus sp.]|jgi:CRISPR-associated protein Cmr5
MRLRQSEIAEKALECITTASAQRDLFDEYGTRANSFPTMILQSGLAQALGFLRAKSGDDSPLKKAYAQYYKDLVALVRVAMPALPPDGEAFYQEVLQAELGDYRRISQITLDSAVWLKRLYQGSPKPKNGGQH